MPDRTPPRPSSAPPAEALDPSADREDLVAALYAAYADRVYRYLLSRTGQPADAEELTSRTFLNALSHLDDFRGRGAQFGAWLMSTAHNLLANWYRDRGRRPPEAPLDDALALPAQGPDPEASFEASEDARRVRRAIRSLPRDRQQLLALKYVEGRTNADIGRAMGRSEGAIKALHHRTLRQLADTLREP